MYTDEEGQIVFLDTPGIHKAKNKLGEYMVSVAESTLRDVDVILWLVEAYSIILVSESSILQNVLERLIHLSFLLLIRLIRLKRKRFSGFIDAYKDICDFAEIIPLSALKGENTENLIPLIFKYMEDGPQYYDEDTVTDQPERQIAAELIREKALRKLDDEIPHGIAVAIDSL